MRSLALLLVAILASLAPALAQPPLWMDVNWYGTASAGWDWYRRAEYGDTWIYGSLATDSASSMAGYATFNGSLFSGYGTVGAYGWRSGFASWEAGSYPLGASAGWYWSGVGNGSLSAYWSYNLTAGSLGVAGGATGIGEYGFGSVWYWNPSKPWESYYERHRLYGNFTAVWSYGFSASGTLWPSGSAPLSARPSWMPPP